MSGKSINFDNKKQKKKQKKTFTKTKTKKYLI